MRTFPLFRAIPILAAIALTWVLSAASIRGDTADLLAVDAQELESFTVDTSEMFPRPSDAADDSSDAEARTIPPEPVQTTDPALNLVPLPAPLAPAMIGVAAVALRLALRGRRYAAARVFRRSR